MICSGKPPKHAANGSPAALHSSADNIHAGWSGTGFDIPNKPKPSEINEEQASTVIRSVVRVLRVFAFGFAVDENGTVVGSPIISA